MPPIPASVADFLACKRIAVAGVSRSGKAPANAVFRRLAETGHAVFAVNPNASQIDGSLCYASITAIPEPVDAVMIVTPAASATAVVQQALDRGVRQVWFHRSFGDGSVSAEAVERCRAGGVEPIVGGCPLMYCGPVDPGHRFFRWWLRLTHRVPG